MIDATIRIASGIYVWALDNSNFETMEKVNVSPSSLRQATDTKVISNCTTVLKLAQELGEELAPYGITADDISLLEKEINDFKDIVGNPRMGIVTRSQATTQLAGLMKKQMDLLKLKLDKLALMFKDSNPVFYNEYKSARIIVNIGSRHQVTSEEAQA